MSTLKYNGRLLSNTQLLIVHVQKKPGLLFGSRYKSASNNWCCKLQVPPNASKNARALAGG